MLSRTCPRLALSRPLRHAYSTAATQAIAPERSRNKTTEQTPASSPERLLYPDRLRTPHHDLPSYLAHAARTGLDPRSTVYIGTHYEYTTQHALSRLGFALQQHGGACDNGIDLLGEWTLPAVPAALRVLVQCKAISKKAGPSLVRELEGAFAGAPAGWQGDGVLGLLVCQKPATKGMREALARSRWPMGSVTCMSDGRLVQMLWNQAAENEGLLGVGVGIRYRNGSMDEKEIHLTWEGKSMDVDG